MLNVLGHWYKSQFISEFEKFERDYFSKNLPIAQKRETEFMQKYINNSSNPFLTLLALIFRLFVRRKRRNMLDKKYDLLHLYGKKQKRYKSYVPSLEEQVRRIEKMRKIAGNIPYQRLISAQGENYKVYVSLSKIPKLYAYGFFFSTRLFNDGAMVTIKEKDKYLFQIALGVDDIEFFESHNKYYKPKSDYAEMKERAKQLGSKIEYLMIEPEQLELLKNETERFIKFHVDGKFRLVFLEENKDFILHALYPEKQPDRNNISGTPNARVQTKFKKSWLSSKSYSYRTIRQDKVNISEQKTSAIGKKPETAKLTPEKNETTPNTTQTYRPRRGR